MTAEKLLLKDYMIPLDDFPHIHEEKSLKDAIEAVGAFTAGERGLLRYTSLLVVNDGFQLTGQLSLRDIVKGIASDITEIVEMKNFQGANMDFPNLAFLLEDKFFKQCGLQYNKQVKTCMSKVGSTISLDTPVLKVMMIMLAHEECVLPVVDNGAVVGVIRFAEIFTAINGQCVLD
ncbi:MAG: CBS domain-containing protein [Desulfobulbaceae bacterium]|uniref:CBS domain-containing protein n=1 Tax=Candidatus Desulfatifera sulfidica TaxID=2841691 RepID=A0A8J6NCE5_9BACT|nr:CBS domain-containing protein [Candidatus Desulfatifera sulfidica]